MNKVARGEIDKNNQRLGKMLSEFPGSSLYFGMDNGHPPSYFRMLACHALFVVSFL